MYNEDVTVECGLTCTVSCEGAHTGLSCAPASADGGSSDAGDFWAAGGNGSVLQ